MQREWGKKESLQRQVQDSTELLQRLLQHYLTWNVLYIWGAEDVERQSLNAYRMELLGAKVHAVESGTRTLKDAINEAMRDWATNIETTFYCIGSVMGPHPYPTMVRDFQKIIGEETKEQMKEIEGKLPDAVFACVGGGSNAMGMFYDFIPDESVRLIGAEAAGRGLIR